MQVIWLKNDNCLLAMRAAGAIVECMISIFPPLIPDFPALWLKSPRITGDNRYTMNQKVRTKREQLNNIDSSYTMYGENKKRFGVLATMRKQEVICNGQYQSLHDREE